MKSDEAKVGSYKLDITPKNKIELYALENKYRSSSKIFSKLFINTIFIQNKKNKVLFITLDLIYVGDKFCEDIKKIIKNKYNINERNILINATHTHSSPLIENNVLNPAKVNSSYIKFLRRKVLISVAKSIKQKSNCKILISSQKIDLNLNRRKKVLNLEELKKFRFKNHFANRPNFNGPKDDDLSFLKFVTNKNQVKCMIINYACHPSLIRDNVVSSDYPGFIRSNIEKYYSKKITICFLLGFCGNLKANLIYKTKFNWKYPIKSFYNLIFDNFHFKKKLSLDEVKKFSKKISNLIIGEDNYTEINPSIKCKLEKLKVQFKKYSLEKIFKKNKHNLNYQVKRYLDLLKRNKNKNYKILTVQKISLSKNLTFLSLSGEVFCEYSIWLKQLASKKNILVIPVSCANGLMGYLSTRKALNEGGYEVDRILIEHGMPTKFEESIESNVKMAIEKIF